MNTLFRIAILLGIAGSAAWAYSEKGPAILVVFWLGSMAIAYGFGSIDGFQEVADEAEDRGLAEIDWETPSGAPRLHWKDREGGK